MTRFKNPAASTRRHRHGHRAGRPAPADPDQRRPRALPGHRRAAGRVGRTRPRLPGDLHRGLRAVRRTRRRPRLGEGRTVDRPDPRPDHRGRGDVPRLRRHRHLLGDGHHPAPQLGGRDQGDRQRRHAPGQHRPVPGPACARCAATPTCRATARWASGSRCPTTSSTPSATSSASSRRVSTATTPSRRSARCATARCGCSWAWAATSSRPRPTPRSPRRPCATARSRCTSPPSSTARTSSPAERR